MKTINQISLFFLFISLLSSCEKVINIDIKDAQAKVIIEGVITDENGQLVHTVLVSKSRSFSSNSNNNPVVGATVVVEDATSMVIDSLKEIKPGVYNTSKIMGKVGHQYKLNVIVDGVSYTASSIMPTKVPLDSIYIQEFPIFGREFKQVIPAFKDQIGSKNFYRFAVQVNDSFQKGFDAWDDLLSDGKVNSRPLQIEAQDLFDGADTVYVTMNNTDSSMYEFFYTLFNASGDAQTPGNPLSNISNGAIGYFGAVTVEQKMVILP